jgi:hypothetical protein
MPGVQVFRVDGRDAIGMVEESWVQKSHVPACRFSER